jgi:hypothetical protein
VADPTTRIPDEVLWAAAERFYRETWDATVTGYELWSRGKGVPSSSTIRKWLGSWTVVMRTVIDKVDRNG